MRVIRCENQRHWTFTATSTYLNASNSVIALHRLFALTFLRSPISTRSSTNRISSSVLAVHLYRVWVSAHARVNRECRLGGSSGLYFGTFPAALWSKVSWYKLRALTDADTTTRKINKGWNNGEGRRDGQASETSSASLKRPGRSQVSERRVDSREAIVEPLWIRKDS
jgi:hypothetical protein